MWLSIEEFKQMNETTVEDNVIMNAIKTAENIFKSKFFIKKQYVYNNKRKFFEIYTEGYLADSNSDWVIDSKDINIFKIGQTKTPLNIKEFRKFLYTPRLLTTITQNDFHPTTKIEIFVEDYQLNRNEKVFLEFFVSFINFEDERHKEIVKQFINFLAQQIILRKFLISSAEGGLTSWSLNGVSVTTSPETIMNQIKEIENRLEELTQKFMGMIYYSW